MGTYTNNGTVAPTYTGDLQHHRATFTVQKPAAVSFSGTPVNVWCYNGSDGEIQLSASGGVGTYSYRFYTAANPDPVWYPFTNATTHTITSLLPGTYFIKVRDGNGCVAKTLNGTGPEKVETITITQPADPLRVDLVSQQSPTAYGFTDGNIHVVVYGGTINANNTYNHTWTDASNNPVTTESTWFANGQYHIQLQNIGAGTYTLTIQDKNFASATTRAGCEVIRSYPITQPPPLTVRLEIFRQPSCNKANTQADPCTDGELRAHARGGTRFSPGLPYLYTWKKKDAQNNWVVMTSYTDSTAAALESGWYAVNVQDANGIILGQYQANVLVQATDSTVFLPEPPLLTINETVTPVSCNAGQNGTIISGVAGGTPPYQYSWNTGESTANLSSLAAGRYFLFVRDANGCRATKAIVVPEPTGYVLTVNATPPTCHDGCDGSIVLNLAGGVPPYTYTWQQTGVNTNTLSNLCSGTYQVTVSDANGCSFARVITLDNPPLLDLGLPRDTTLCNGQSARLSIAINDPGASYSWTSDNGFTSTDPTVVLTAAGNYYARLTNGRGCVGTATITIRRLNLDIAADMLLPTSAITGEEIVLVNVSRPLPQIVEWILPPAATILERTDNFIRFSFAAAGTYPITLRTGINACREQVTKNVIVSPDAGLPGVGVTAPPFIEDLKVLPIPNDGTFTVELRLRQIAEASLRLVYVNSSAVVSERQLRGNKQYVERFSLPGLAPGLYMLVVQTPQAVRTIKVMIMP
ncbi:SprB repeat-containing protein [Hymenobacter sp. BT664]|uniref:SprB repeat-containing protein n=1 Tax=Hymenobacter montanus TaxID=2771359 RepID=A0A927BE84_9BACT|nr:SprB repeat-containing protein [Hymenobacter montanus]